MILITFLFYSFIASAHELTLSEFLESAWQSNSTQAIEQGTQEVIDQRIASARGKYYPHVTLEALDTDGFPASNSDLHIGGVMGSPFRKGWAAGVVVEETVYDFGRIGAALEQAKAEGILEEAKLANSKMHYLSSLGGLYLSCSRTRSLLRLNDRLMAWTKLLMNETTKYAKTGQRSIVDRSLIQSEVMDLELQKSELEKYESTLQNQMKLYSENVECQRLSQSWQPRLAKLLQVPEPSLLLARAQLEISKASYDGALAAQRPTIKLTGSAGDMQQARLVPEKDYSVGVGIAFPIWNGGEDSHREQSFRSAANVQNEILKIAETEVQRKILGLKEGYVRNKESLAGLEQNLEQIRKTMSLASKRYQRLEGELIDVRDSFRQMRAIETRRIEVLSSLSTESLELALLK